MHAALQEDLGATEGNERLDFFGNLFVGKDKRIWIARGNAERTEGATTNADISVIDIAFDDVGADVGVAELVGSFGSAAGEIVKRTVLIQFQGLFTS